MKKIMHIGYEHRNKDVRIFKKECMTLSANKNYEITYVTSSKNSTVGTDEENGVKIVVKQLSGARGRQLLRYIKDVKAMAIDEDFDLCHIHEYILLPLVAPLKKAGKKVIYDKHEHTVPDVKYRVTKKYGKFIGRLAEKFIKWYEESRIRKADAFIVVTPNDADCSRDVDDKSVMIPNFPIIDNKEIRETSVESFRKNSGVICFAGGISDNWSIRKIVRIIGKIDGAKLLLAGPCSEAYLSELKDTAGWEKVEYVGQVPFEKVQEIYSRASIGIAVLHHKVNIYNKLGTLGNTKMFETMQAGLPVICTDTEVWRPIIEDNDCGICVDAEDDDSIEKAILFFMHDPEGAFKMGRNGQAAIAEKYNWQAYENKLRQVYADVIGWEIGEEND